MGYSLRGFLRQAITAGGTHPHPAGLWASRKTLIRIGFWLGRRPLSKFEECFEVTYLVVEK